MTRNGGKGDAADRQVNGQRRSGKREGYRTRGKAKEGMALNVINVRCGLAINHVRWRFVIYCIHLKQRSRSAVVH